MPLRSHTSFAAVEATVTSKGQVTLPSEVRKRLGLQKGSRIRFSMPSGGAVKIEPIRYRVQDLWVMADESGKTKGGKAKGVLSFEEMNLAKARRLPR